MFGFLKTLFSRSQPAVGKQDKPPAVDLHGAPSAAASKGPQQAISENELVDKLKPAPDELLMTLVGSKTEVELADWKSPGKSDAAQDLETPEWKGKETPVPEPEVVAAGSANIKRSGRAADVSVVETTVVTSPTPKPKSLRTATSKTTAVKKKVKTGSKKAGGTSETRKKAASQKAGPAEPKT